MSGYIGTLSGSSLDRVLDHLFEKLKDQGLFQQALNNKEIQGQIKANIVSAIDSQKLSIHALKDAEFSKRLVLAFLTSYVMGKYNTLTPNLSILFKKIYEEPEEFAKLLKEILVARNKLVPRDKQLSENDLNKIVEKIMESDDPEKEFEKMISELASEQVAKEQRLHIAAPKPGVKQKDELEIDSRLVAGYIPISELQLGGAVQGHIGREHILQNELLSPEHLMEQILDAATKSCLEPPRPGHNG